MLGSGNLGLIYLMEEPRRLTLEEIDERHPQLIAGAARRIRTSAGCSCARPSTGRSSLGPRGAHYLADGRVVGDDPLAPFSPNAARHLRRTDGFAHVADIMVNSFYDPELDEGCAFEELISFHGGIGGCADAGVHPAPGDAAAARRADRRRRRGARRPARLAPPLQGGAAPAQAAGTAPAPTHAVEQASAPS